MALRTSGRERVRGCQATVRDLEKIADHDRVARGGGPVEGGLLFLVFGLDVGACVLVLLELFATRTHARTKRATQKETEREREAKTAERARGEPVRATPRSRPSTRERTCAVQRTSPDAILHDSVASPTAGWVVKAHHHLDGGEIADGAGCVQDAVAELVPRIQVRAQCYELPPTNQSRQLGKHASRPFQEPQLGCEKANTIGPLDSWASADTHTIN